MKKVKIYWTAFASKCIEDIHAYIEEESKSAAIASRYITKLMGRVDQLENFPNSGAAEPLLNHLKNNSRYLVEGNYKIIYQYNDSHIIVTDVFHVKQNPVKIKKRSKK